MSGTNKPPLGAAESIEMPPVAEVGRVSMPQDDLCSPELYLNRELSWLKFNLRVLSEANDARVPLLERVKFLAIVSSNIDEFCMKRIGGLRLQIDAGMKGLTVDGRDPVTQVSLCSEEIARLVEAKNETYGRIVVELKKQGIVVYKYADLDKSVQSTIRKAFEANVLPVISPLAIDASHPFPFISNLSLNVFVTLKRKGSEVISVRIKVPLGDDISRYTRLPKGAAGVEYGFVSLEDILINNLDLLFPDLEVLSADVFRITRNANTVSDYSDAGDLVEKVEVYLRDRKFAPVVRMQVNPSMMDVQRASLTSHLGIDIEHSIITVSPVIGMADLMELAALDIPALRRSDHHCVEIGALQGKGSIFDQIDLNHSVLVEHPYESFRSSVERFVKESSEDPKVSAIKMTLYRTSTDTRIIDYLINAAEAGKQVSVIVELTASFCEQANIEWSNRLEQAGIHVSYGIEDLKTHCKIILVVRKEGENIRRYAHIGTGNYHAQNARMYSDLSILTSDQKLATDLGELFNYLTTGAAPFRPYKKLLTAPQHIKKALLSKIAREAKLAKKGKKGLIRFKTNALEDPDIVAGLYAASQAGVKVELIVRDICRLRPGLTGVSEKISVVSIVGQFLEHGRIYHFQNGGKDEYFIGSADLMSRNLERRVEILIPVTDKAAKKRLGSILKNQISDMRSAWSMRSSGEYIQLKPVNGDPAAGSQQLAMAAAIKRSRPKTRESILTLIRRQGMSKSKPDKKSEGEANQAKSLKLVKAAKMKGGEKKGQSEETDKDKAAEHPTRKIGSARGVESMFRNSYRAQLSMIALAATKANIMISLNGLLVSMLLLSGAYILSAEPLFLVPISILLLTCTVAITFAVLAARPDIDKRDLSFEDFASSKADMLIFEQFSKLSSEEFTTAMWEMLDDNERIYRSMITHIYDLGCIADKKFARLHISYNSFMVGLIISVLSLLAVLGAHLYPELSAIQAT